MADETDPEVTACPVCGVEPEVWTDEDIEAKRVVDGYAGTIKSGWMCPDGHFICEQHKPATLADVDQHRIADVLDSIDARLADQEEAE
jgi:hypothetical protein